MFVDDIIINYDDLILITGSSGFIGTKVVETLLSYGFRKLRCFDKASSVFSIQKKFSNSFKEAQIEPMKGDLFDPTDCKKAANGVSVIFHLAAGFGKSFQAVYKNSVQTTKNLLDAVTHEKKLKRFINVSSFAVYSNKKIKRGGLLDESCDVEKEPERCGEAYCYGKVKQEELLLEYNKKYSTPYVIVRPGAVYGPGNKELTGRLGVGRFGIFLHIGGSNILPLTYIDNCSDAIVLAGIKKGVDGEVFNIVDDELPRSREFLKMYKKKVRNLKSVNIPYYVIYFLGFVSEICYEWLAKNKSQPEFNRRRCETYWKGNQYTNTKLKNLLGWKPKVSITEGTKRYFDYLKGLEESNKLNKNT